MALFNPLLCLCRQGRKVKPLSGQPEGGQSDDRKPEGVFSALSLRRRSVWEAADSGILLWRKCLVYFIPYLAIPVWVAACCLRFLPENLFFLAYLILWWLKPFFDRLALHVVSKRFFDKRAYSANRELRSGLSRAITFGLAGDLLWRRFSPYRASRMPLKVLERAGGSQYRQRKNALIPGGINFCSIVSAFGLAAEAVLLFGEVAFTAIAARMFFPSSTGFLQNIMDYAGIFVFAAFCFNYILVESLYVCMGFGLYINSRVEVEGWDLQLLFQKFAGTREQEEKPIPAPAGKTAALLCLFLALFLAPSAVYGESNSSAAVMEEWPLEFFPSDFPVPEALIIEALNGILARPDFGSEKEGWGIRLKQSAPPPDIPEIEFSPWMELLNKIMAFALRLLVILVTAAFLGFSLYWLRKGRRNASRGKRPSVSRQGDGYANPLFSDDSPESLFARSADLFAGGYCREAWAACLLGCIVAYRQYHSLSFPLDATEYGCLAMVKEGFPGEASGFEKLIRNWVFLAYGGRRPAAGAFEEALAYGRSLLATASPEARALSVNPANSGPTEANSSGTRQEAP